MARRKRRPSRVSRETNDYDHLEEYDRYLLQALVAISAKANDRDRLVKLLSAKSPRFVSGAAIELEIALLEIDRPLLILFDSYDKATRDQRRYLVDILRHAFIDLSKDHPDDAGFVRTSKTWYLENDSRMKPNPYYHPFFAHAEQRDLLVPKNQDSP